MHLNWIWRARFIFLPAFAVGLVSLAVLIGLCFATPTTYRFPYLFSAQPLPCPPQPVSISPPRQEERPAPRPQIKLLPLEQRQRKWWPVIRRLSRRYGLDPCLVMALVQVESSFNPWAQSNRGAQGLMQINAPTARHLGLEDPLDPQANLEAGIRYLAWLKKIFRDDMVLTLAAYNAGPTKVLELGRVPDHKETRAFVVKVLGSVDRFRQRFQALARR